MRNYIAGFKRGYADRKEGSEGLVTLGTEGLRTVLHEETPEGVKAADSMTTYIGKISRGYVMPFSERAGNLAYGLLHPHNVAQARAVSDTYQECLSLTEGGEIPKEGMTVKKSLRRLKRRFQ